MQRIASTWTLMVLAVAAGGWPLASFGAEKGLTLHEAIVLSLEHNLDLKLSGISEKDFAGRRLKSEGDFDWVLGGTGSRRLTSTPSASALDGVSAESVLKTEAKQFTLGLDKKLSFGPVLGVDYTYGITDSNSSYSTVNPAHQVNLAGNVELSLLKALTPSYFRRALAQAELDWEVAKLKYGEALSDAIYKTAEKFFAVLEAAETVRLKEQALKHAHETEKFVEAKERVGRSSLVDRVDAESEARKSEDALIRASDQLVQAQEQFIAHVWGDGAKASEVLVLNGEWDVPETLTVDLKKLKLDDLVREAELSRPELARVRKEIEKAEAGARAAKADLFPEVKATGELSYTGLGADFAAANKPVTKMKYRSYKAGLEVSMPLMRSAARGAHQGAELRVEQEHIREQEIRRDIVLEIRKALRDADTAERRVGALSKAVEAEEKKYEAKRARQEAGRASIYELNQALDDRVKAETELLKARMAQKRSVFQLAKARGKLITLMNVN